MDTPFSYQLFIPQTLKAASLKAYLPFVIPQAKKIFSEKNKDGTFSIGIAAFYKQTMIGISFGEAYSILEQATIYSLFVDENMRRQGVGTELLKLLMEGFLDRKISLLHVSFFSGEVTASAVEKILTKLNWKAPQIILERYYFHLPTFAPDWYLSSEPLLPKTLHIGTWGDLKKNQIQAIKKIIKSNSILEDLSPFEVSYPLMPLNSLVLKTKTEIVGWLITHRIDEHTICYSSLYVDRELRGQGPAICLLKNAIRKQKESHVKYAYTEINYKRTPLYWQQFVKKRLAPHCVKKEATLYSFYHKPS